MIKKSIRIGFLVILGVLFVEPARAVLVLKQIQVSNGNQVELQFDRDFDVKAIKTEFYKDIIQLSLNNVSVYPPKIFSVDGTDVSKVFAYQYTPKLVRCRLTVRGNAETFKNKVTLRSKGKSLTLVIGSIPPTKDKVVLQAAKAVSAPQPAGVKAEKDSSSAFASILKPEDKATLDKVLRTNAKESTETATQRATSHLTGQAERTAQVVASRGSSMSKLIRTFAWMTVVLIALAGVLVFVRKGLRGKMGSKGWLVRIMKGKFGVSGKLIEVEATHYLGPKKSIAVVKVQGRRLVLGITDESINLITQLEGVGGAESDAGEMDLIAGLTGDTAQKSTPGHAQKPGTGATAAGPSRFSDILASSDAKNMGSVRDQIRRRVEGLKTL